MASDDEKISTMSVKERMAVFNKKSATPSPSPLPKSTTKMNSLSATPNPEMILDSTAVNRFSASSPMESEESKRRTSISQRIAVLSGCLKSPDNLEATNTTDTTNLTTPKLDDKVSDLKEVETASTSTESEEPRKRTSISERIAMLSGGLKTHPSLSEGTSSETEGMIEGFILKPKSVADRIALLAGGIKTPIVSSPSTAHTPQGSSTKLPISPNLLKLSFGPRPPSTPIETRHEILSESEGFNEIIEGTIGKMNHVISLFMLHITSLCS